MNVNANVIVSVLWLDKVSLFMIQICSKICTGFFEAFSSFFFFFFFLPLVIVLTFLLLFVRAVVLVVSDA